MAETREPPPQQLHLVQRKWVERNNPHRVCTSGSIQCEAWHETSESLRVFGTSPASKCCCVIVRWFHILLYYIPFMNQGCSIWSTSFSSKYSTCAAGRSRSIQHSTSHAEPRPSHGWKVANTFKCNSPFPASEPSKIRKKVVDWPKQKNVPTKSEDADWHKSKKVISIPALTRVAGPVHIVKMSRRAGPLHKHARCTPESDLKAITITSHLPSRYSTTCLSSPKMNWLRTYSTMLTWQFNLFSNIFDFHTLVRSGQIWNLRLVKSGKR